MSKVDHYTCDLNKEVWTNRFLALLLFLVTGVYLPTADGAEPQHIWEVSQQYCQDPPGCLIDSGFLLSAHG